MYEVTDYEIINGSHITEGKIKPGFFKTFEQIDDYQRVLTDYFQLYYVMPITVLVNHKVPVSEHVDWNKPKTVKI